MLLVATVMLHVQLPQNRSEELPISQHEGRAGRVDFRDCGTMWGGWGTQGDHISRYLRFGSPGHQIYIVGGCSASYVIERE